MATSREADREALKEYAQEAVEAASRGDGIPDDQAEVLGRGVLSLLAELERGRAGYRKLAKDFYAMRLERDQLKAEVARLREALEAVAVSKFATEPHRIARDALGEDLYKAAKP